MKLIQFEPLFLRHFSTEIWPFPLHNHNHYELMFISRGTGVHELNQYKSVYEGETIFFLAPEDSHDFIIEQETQFSVIKFLPSVLKGGANVSKTDYWDHLLTNLARKWKLHGEKSFDLSLISRAKSIINLMILEWQDNNMQVTELHSNLLRSLLLILDKYLKSNNDDAIANYGVSLIERVQNYIHAHIYFPDRLSVKHLSSIFGLSDSGLRGLFKSKMEMPLSTYINALKLESIKERIKTSNNSLTEIAQEFGFTDASHFNKFFKKQTDISPLSYRKQK